jgi:hypothetical protein
MTKKIAIGTKPTSLASADVPSADAWVESRTTEQMEQMKRLTIDIPASLHCRVKAQCAMRGSKIADEVRELLLQKYGNTEISK